MKMAVDDQPPAIFWSDAFYQLPHFRFTASRLSEVQGFKPRVKKLFDAVRLAVEKVRKSDYGQKEVHEIAYFWILLNHSVSFSHVFAILSEYSKILRTCAWVGIPDA